MIKEEQIKRLQFLAGILLEGSPLGKNPLEQNSKRLGVEPSKVQTFALHREKFPTKDISGFKSKEQFDKEFKEWFDQMVEALSKVKPFTANKDMASKYLEAFSNNIHSLGTEAKPISIKDPEKTLVDVCNNNHWVEQEVAMASNKGMEDPHQEDVVHEDDNVVIIKAPKKSKCILYGQGESWCIGRADLNSYVTYRIQYGASIYFVLQKNKPKEDNERKLVILNYGQNGYAIADRSNSGNRHGGPDLAGSWSKVESEIPSLKGLERLFIHNNVSQEERKYEYEVSQELVSSNVLPEIEGRIKGLTIDGEPVTVSDFLRDYLAAGKNLSDQQFASIDQRHMAELVEFGLSLNDGQFKLLSEKTKRRYISLVVKNGKRLTDIQYSEANSELKIQYMRNCISRNHNFSDIQYASSPPELKEEYMRWAVNVSRGLSSSKYANTPPNLRAEYLAKRLLSGNYLTNIEYIDASNEQKAEYISKCKQREQRLTDEQYMNTPLALKYAYFNDAAKGHFILDDKQYGDMTPELKIKYMRASVKKQQGLTNAQYAELSPELRSEYISARLTSGFGLLDGHYADASTEMKAAYLKLSIDNRWILEDEKLSVTPPELKKEYLKTILHKGWHLSDNQYEELSPELKIEYVLMAGDKGWNLSRSQYENLSLKHKMEYMRRRIKIGNMILNDVEYAKLPPELKVEYLKSEWIPHFKFTFIQKADMEKLKAGIPIQESIRRIVRDIIRGKEL